MIKHFYGWKRDPLDRRDLVYEPTNRDAAVYPKQIDLRTLCPPVYDQGQLGSCTANAVSAALDFMRKKQGEKFIKPSRLFVYYNERKDEGTINSDSGASIRESVKAVVSYGACHETLWPYVIADYTKLPTDKCYMNALTFEALKYMSVNPNLASFQSVLSGGDPIVIGISVYESFESDEVTKTGIVPMPMPSEKLLGGHAVMVVGYDIDKEVFICRNSWGTDWGMKGYFTIPVHYLMNGNLANDFWVIQTVK